MGVHHTEPAVSVVLCTRNRRQALEATLRHFGGLGDSTAAWELIVVDNGSSDGTAELLDAAVANSRLPLHRVLERRPGLSRARNTGVRAARAPVVAFTDDDCRVAPDWVDRIAGILGSDSSLGALGGRVEPGPGVDARISTRRHGAPQEIRSLAEVRNLMMGANMAFRRAVLAGVGPFDESLGAGAPCRSGEDVDLLFRALRAGHRIAYRPEVVVEHHHDRSTDEDLRRLRLSYLTGRGALAMKRLTLLDYGVAKDVYWELSGIFRPDRPTPEVDPAAIPRGLRVRQVALGAGLWAWYALARQLLGPARSDGSSR